MTETAKVMMIDETIDRAILFGNLDSNLTMIEERFDVVIVQRDGMVTIKGEKMSEAEMAINELCAVIRKEGRLDRQKVSYILDLAEKGVSYSESQIDKDVVAYTHAGKPIKPKTIGQKYYVRSMKNREVVFGIGPAGTGKTYLAVAMAVSAFKKKEVNKIILTRPAVEAGERLGFLPGDLQDKVDPYLRPLYDALYDVLGRDAALRLKEKEVIEVVPLAYMRGRTLDNAFIILDEAQNTTREQMKMFLTRMGFGSRMVITGDITQIDLPDGKMSGLKEAARILKDVDGIDFCYLKDTDVVRHELVKKIINAYDRFYGKKQEEQK